MISLTIKGDKELKRWFGKVQAQHIKEAEKTLTRTLVHLRDKIVEKLSGKILNVKTSRLLTGIAVIPAKATPSGWDGKVFTNVKYARIQEKGGVITPKTSLYLVIYLYKLGIFRKVRSVTIPARPYFYPTLPEEADWITGEFKQFLSGLAQV